MFKTTKGRSNRSSKDYDVSVRVDGLELPTRTVAKFYLSRYTQANFFFDEDRNVIGLAFYNPEKPRPKDEVIQIYKRDSWRYVIRDSKFIKRWNIPATAFNTIHCKMKPSNQKHPEPGIYVLYDIFI